MLAESVAEAGQRLETAVQRRVRGALANFVSVLVWSALYSGNDPRALWPLARLLWERDAG